MEIVVIITMLLVGLSLMLKLTYLPAWGRVVISLLCALFVGLNWENAASQSKAQIADWLQNPELMLDIAVILTIDVFMQVAFCCLNARYVAGEKMGKAARIIRLVVMWFPGLLIFPSLFALLTEVVFSMPGADFVTLAWGLAAGVLVAFAILPFAVAWAVPEKDLRLELMFMINGLIALLGVVATVNGRTAVAGTNSVEWQPLLSVALILLVGAAAGYLLFLRNNNKKLSQIK